MKITIHKKPSKVTLSGAFGLLLLFCIATLLIDDINTYFVLVFVLGIALVFLLIKSFAAPYFSGVEINNGKIEAITSFGGLINIQVGEIDHEKSSLTTLGLQIVPISGESLFLSATEYSKEDILRVAHYVGMSDSGWSQCI
ncbi:hypothetical protein [Lysobacter sp. F6437]|uniref:hypothetical protein n=1 Tax=Lysobacter sp. F6437 TaxID=3459296 RepID=UPI00403DD646